MLESLLLGGIKTPPGVTIAVSSNRPAAGSTLAVTVTATGLTDADALAWAIADGTTLLASAFATSSGAGRTTGKVWKFNITMPYKSANTNKIFRIGVGKSLADARAGVLGLSADITMGGATASAGSQNYPSAGTYYLTVPEFVTYMSVTAVAGGGGGGASVNSYGGAAGTPGTKGGSGSTGFNVVPGERITISIGAGGAYIANQNGGTGGNTTISRPSGGTALTVVGGSGGIYAGGEKGGDGGRPVAAGSGTPISGLTISPNPGTPGAGGFGGSVSFKAATAGSAGAARITW